VLFSKVPVRHPLWKSVWRFLKKEKQNYLMILLHHSWIYTPKEWKSAYNRDSCTPMFTAAHFQPPSYGISLGAQLLMSE
jgi:hypothetical protein